MKKQKTAKKEANVEDNHSDESGDDISLEENVDVEFELFGLGENDLDGIDSLLKQLFMKDDVDVTQIAKILIDQVNVGCIFMTATDDSADTNQDNEEHIEDNEIYGIVSMLNLTENENKSSVQQIKKLVQKYGEKNGDEACRKKFSDFLQSLASKKTGLLINERFINLPHHIALPALKSLSKEIDKGGKNYDQFMAILKMHKADLSGASSSSSKNKNSATKRKRTSRKLAEPKDGESIFVNAEEEFLFEECEAYFDYFVEEKGESSSCNAVMELKPYRRIVLFNRNGFDKFIEKLDSDINASCN